MSTYGDETSERLARTDEQQALNPDYRSGRLPREQVTAEDVRRAAEIVHVQAAIDAIHHYHRIVSRFPGTEAYRATRFLKKLIRDIPKFYHTHEETGAWNSRVPPATGEDE